MSKPLTQVSRLLWGMEETSERNGLRWNNKLQQYQMYVTVWVILCSQLKYAETVRSVVWFCGWWGQELMFPPCCLLMYFPLTFCSLPVTWCTNRFNIQQLCALPTLYLCVLYLSEKKQWFLPHPTQSKSKAKSNPITVLDRPIGSRISRQSAHEGSKVVSPTHWTPLPPQEIFLVLISVIRRSI
jgi:hypothetical protein